MCHWVHCTMLALLIFSASKWILCVLYCAVGLKSSATAFELIFLSLPDYAKYEE